ncbi:MAG: hypothetical protein GC137_02960 [Alphaproteobacteria bacterium]|nr:hypothetical protein [Alphaproteobacteria bacterium]
MLQDNDLRERFGLTSKSHGSIQAFLIAQGPWAKLPFLFNGQGFKKMPLAIAFALETDAVDLWGDPNAPENFIKNKLLEHYKSDWSTYRPAVAKAMQVAGIQQLKNLTDRAYDLYQAIGHDISREAFATSVSTIISKSNKQRDTLVFSGADYSDLATVLAAVLNQDPEVLFGQSPKRLAETCLDGNILDQFERAAEPFEIERKDLAERCDAALSVLEERRRNILERRHGLNGYEPQTLEEIGLDLRVTRERVRQLEEKAFNNLWDKADLRPLLDFL